MIVSRGRPRAATVLAVTAAVTLAAACSDSDNGADATSDGAAATTTTTAAPAVEVSVTTLNVLHGLFCDYEETDWCNAPARLQIVFELLEEAGCPDLVGLQEIGPRQEELVTERLPELCDGAYELSWGAQPGPDREMILSGLPIVGEGFLDLASFPWEAPYVRVRAGDATVDFLTAHFASSSNNPICDAELCPPVCPAGITTNECHALEVVDLYDGIAEPATLTIVAGDLNARPGEATIAHLLDGGFVDAWRSSGQPECDGAGGPGCTGSGDEPETPYIGMDTVEGLPYVARIDYVLVRAEPACDADIATNGFADEPRATPVDGLYWPSDHKGLSAVVTCR
jgi:endonuclease/exonuclease/phosphatase family metal-dependent hydrolase